MRVFETGRAELFIHKESLFSRLADGKKNGGLRRLRESSQGNKKATYQAGFVNEDIFLLMRSC